MKFLSVRDIRNHPGSVFGRLKKEKEIVLTAHGKPVALLCDLNEDSFEEDLSIIRGSRALHAMHEMQKISRAKGNDRMTDKEIEAEIQAARRSRR